MPSTVRPPLVPTLIPILMVFVASPAFSQQPSKPPSPSTPSFADEVTVTATGIEIDIDDAPAAVTIITRDEMDDAQADRVVDILRRVPSVVVVGSGNEGTLTSLFTRGTNSNQTLVMLDGVRLNTPFFGGFDWSRLSTGGLEQVEVVRGPYSPLWGADAVGGVVHLRSRHAREGLDGRFFSEGGSNGWQRLEADIGWGDEMIDVYASGYDRQGNGELDNSDFSSRQLLITAGVSFGKRGSRLGVVAQNVETEAGIPFASPGDLRPDRRQWGDHTLIAVPITWHISDRWSVEAVAARVDTGVEFSDPDDMWFSESLTETTSRQVRLTSHHHLGRHVLSWGGEWRSDEVDDASNFGANLDGEQVEVTSFFLQEAWAPSRALRLLIGARWDDADSWGSETSPRANLAWRLSERVELAAGYGAAFRPPSIGELYYPFSGNQELSAETSSSADLGFIFTNRGGTSRIEVSGFSTELENLIEFDYATSRNHNVGSATINGVEMAWTRSLGRRGASFIQATYLDTEGDDGLPLLRRPEWSGTWTLHGQLSKHVSGDVTLMYVGTRDDVDPITYQRSSTPSYTTGDLSLAYSLWNGVELTARALNIFDKRYSEVLGYPAPGRRYFFGLRLGVDTPSRWRASP